MMKDTAGKTGRKKEPWLRFYPHKWLWGTTATELTLPQQAVFIKLLSLAYDGLGDVDITYPKTLAAKLLVPQKLLESTLKRCSDTTKIVFIEKRLEKRRIARFISWKKYQAEYLHRGGDSTRERTPKTAKDAARIRGGVGSNMRPASAGGSKDRGGEERRGEERKGEGGVPPTDTKPSSREEEELPEIPKGLPFKIKDELGDLRHEYNDLVRLAADDLTMRRLQKRPSDVEDHAARIRKRYLQLIADYGGAG